MRTLATLLLGIVIGMAALLAAQHPGSIQIMRGAFGVTPASPPLIRSDARYPDPAWCAAHPQLLCK
jgi:hypothetical protein